MITPREFAKGIQTMLDNNLGGRLNCCSRGMCCTHLSEDHPAGGTASTIHLGSSIAVVPNFASQELVASFARAAHQVALDAMGVRYCIDCGRPTKHPVGTCGRCREAASRVTAA